MGVSELNKQAPTPINVQLDHVVKAAEAELDGELVVSAILIVRTSDRMHTFHSSKPIYELLGLLELSKVALLEEEE